MRPHGGLGTSSTSTEVFNDASWIANRDGTVVDWLRSSTTAGACSRSASSDSHGITGSPVGYPRTIALGSTIPTSIRSSRDEPERRSRDDPGGIYVTTRVGEAASPGETAARLGTRERARAREAASWVDVDAIDVVVDGQMTVQTIDIRERPRSGASGDAA